MMSKVIALGADEETCDRLVERIGNGDREALARLFALEAARLIAIARRIVRRRDLAEEIVQESFVAAWRHAPTFDPNRGHARAWLTMIVRNRALNLVRDESRMDLATEDELADYRQRGDAAYAAYESLNDGEALKRCLETLEPQRRQTILLSYVVGYSHGEIAAQLAVPVGTVKAWIRRSVLSLQDCLS